MLPLSRQVYVNCERTDPGLLSEPFNAVTGVLFFIVAYLIYKQYKTLATKPGVIRFLIIITAWVGAGSIAFHTTARMWAAILDILPIVIFAISYLYLFARHILRLSSLGSVFLLVAFAAVNVGYKATHFHSIDGYISLIPTLICLLLISLHMIITQHKSRIGFSLATILACIATMFRAADVSTNLCEHFPIGTHFIWHILMAGFFYFNMRELVRDYRSDVHDDGRMLLGIWTVITVLVLIARIIF